LNKVTLLKDAIASSVKKRSTVAFAGSGGRISIAGAYEIARQGTRGLSFVSAGTGAPCLDILVGAKLVDRAEISFTMVTCLNIKRALEQSKSKKNSHRLRIEDYSNLAMSLRFFAGATRIPFVPIMSLRGSDIERIRTFKGKEKMAVMTSPFKDRSKVAVLPPCDPDVAIMHAQYADEDGNVLTFGPDGSDGWLLRSAKHRIITVEKIVSKDYVREHKNHTYLPGFLVDNICEVPYGAHPYGLVGCYDLDSSFQKDYSKRSSTQELFDDWAEEWIFGIENRDQYLNKVGKEKLARISTAKFLSGQLF
jgi:glutaconate CoA-transferase subunit A